MEEYLVLQRVWLPVAILLVCQTLVGTQIPPGPVGPGGRPGTRPSTTMAPFALAPPSEYRLVNAIGSPGMGKVEAYYNGTWRPVCSTYRWDNNDANVLCRSLGYAKGVKASPRSFPPKEEKKEDDEGEGTPGIPRPVDGPSIGIIRPSPSPPPVVVKLNLDFNCAGKEDRLDECPGQWVPNCYTDTAAICFTGGSNEKKVDGVRLVTPDNQPPTSLMAIGKVEVLHRGFWGTICTRGNSFREQEASSVCRALGYRSGSHVYRGSLSIRSSADPVFWFGQFDCNETTTDLGLCSKEELGVATCSSHYYDALVLCVNTTEPYWQLRMEAVKLTNTTQGQDWVMGRVEVQVGGQWGSVCERRRYSGVDWTETNAKVVCRQQGFTNGIPVMSSVFGTKKQPIFLFNRECPDGASDLNACRATNGYREYDCTKGGAGVFCTNAEDDCALLAPPKPPSRGFPGPRGEGGRPGPRPIPGGTTTSQPKTSTTPKEIPERCVSRLRVVGNPDPEVDPEMRGKAGRIEYYYQGLWGPICAVGFDDREAHVICKSLGLKTGRAMVNSSFGEGEGPNWLSHLQCAGNENTLRECLDIRGNNVLNYPSCSKKHQAGVVCEGDGEENVAVRLVNKDIKKGKETFNGVVEVRYKGHWGTICSNGWDDRDASVVCREMGYATGFATSNNTQGVGTRPVWLEGVDCQGNEKGIMDCLHSGWAEKSMFALCDHSNDAGALCIEGKKADTGKKGNEQKSQNTVSGTAKASSQNASSQNALSSFLAVFLIMLSSFNMAK